VLVLEAPGYGFHGGEWELPCGIAPAFDCGGHAMHEALMRRTDVLGGCRDSDEETEIMTIVNLIEAYEAQQWPHATNPAGSAESE
jgi:hypothetical protein